METHNETKGSNRDRQSAKTALLDELLQGCSTEQDLFGPQGLFAGVSSVLKVTQDLLIHVVELMPLGLSVEVDFVDRRSRG